MLKTNKRAPALRLAALVLGNAVFGVLLMALCHAHWESDDGYLTAGIASGLYGAASARLVYSNVVLGLVLKALYALAPGAAWYWLVLLAATVAAYAAAGWVLLDKFGMRWGLTLYLPFVLTTAYSFYIPWNFTRAAALAAAAGWVCLLYGTARGTGRAPLWAGGALCYAGFLIRPDAWLMTTAFPVAYLTAAAVTALAPRQRGGLSLTAQIKSLCRRALPIGAFLALVLLSTAADRLAYQSGAWHEYQVYNQNRGDLFDYPMPDYEENEDAIAALGLSEEDYEMVVGWNCADLETLDSGALATLLALQRAERAEDTVLNGWTLQSAAMRFAENPLFLLGAVFTLMGLCSALRLRWLPALGLYGASAVLLTYLVYYGRCPERVTLSLGAAFALFAAYSLRPARSGETPPAVPAVLAAALCVPLLLQGTKWLSPDTYRSDRLTAAEMAEQRDEVSEKTNEDTLYLQDVGAGIQFWELYPLWQAPAAGSERNFYSLGGWGVMLPMTNDALAEYGVTNPMRALGENDRVRLIDGSADSVQEKVDYVRRHYHGDVSWSVCGTVLGRLIVAVTDNTLPCGAQNDAVGLTLTGAGEAKDGADYISYTGTLDAAPGSLNTDDVWCLLVTDGAGQTRAFRFDPEESGNGYAFTLGIAADELPAGSYTVTAATRAPGASAYDWQTQPIPLTVSYAE